jgi:hypothetical protein
LVTDAAMHEATHVIYGLSAGLCPDYVIASEKIAACGGGFPPFEPFDEETRMAILIRAIAPAALGYRGVAEDLRVVAACQDQLPSGFDLKAIDVVRKDRRRLQPAIDRLAGVLDVRKSLEGRELLEVLRSIINQDPAPTDRVRAVPASERIGRGS